MAVLEVDPIVRLRCAVQQYAWGVKGKDSLVARIKRDNDCTFTIDPDSHYAEIWMGTHPNGPSLVETPHDSMLLSEYLDAHELPQFSYLFKVLSVNKSLSIQVHPDKRVAAELHARSPQHYPDANHKPEMAIAITPFKAMVGTRSWQDISAFLAQLPPLREALESALIESSNKSDVEKVKTLVGKLIALSPEQLKPLCDAVLSCPNDLDGLFAELHAQHPYDVGCLFIYILNVLELQPGEAVFLDANTPHAYLKGDVVECMANSDNVVRLGLTPKYKDMRTMVEITDFSCKPAYQYHVHPKEKHTGDPGVRVLNYAPSSIDEFQVTAIKINGIQTMSTITVRGGGVLLVLEGQVEMEFISKSSTRSKISAKKGDVLFFPLPGEMLLREQKTETPFWAFIAEQNERDPLTDGC